MIWRLWLTAGRIAYWLSWPLLYIYLRGSRRTRVLVVCGSDLLVVRGWLSDGGWHLPGGGLKRGETLAEGAVRELLEETGIEVNTTELQLLIKDETIRQNGIPFRLYAFAVKLSVRPELKRQAFEITQLAWKNWRELVGERSLGTDGRRALDAFYVE